MSDSKKFTGFARIMSFVVTLLDSGDRGMTKQEILTTVKGYRERNKELKRYKAKKAYSKEAAEKYDLLNETITTAFARDKLTMKTELNIALTSYIDDEGNERYRIKSDREKLPRFSREELAVLFAATEVWNGDNMLNAGFTREKFISGNLIDPDNLPEFPVIHLKNPGNLDRLYDAIADRQKVKFNYASRSSGKVTERVVEPLHMTQEGGWYLRARDSAHNWEERWFKLSRILNTVTVEGEPEAFERDPNYVPPSPHAGYQMVSPVVAISPEAGPVLTVTAHTDGQVDEATGWQIYTLPEQPGMAWAGPLASYGSRLKVIGPPELRDEVISLLKAASKLKGKQALRKASKKGTKKGSKPAAKRASKSTAKPAAKRATKPAAKPAAKRATKPVAKKGGKKDA